MSIIIEGPDNSGKSTLCKAFEALTDLTIVHAGGPSESVNETNGRLETDLCCWSNPRIMDRSFAISNFIYSLSIASRSVDFDFSFYMKLLACHIDAGKTTLIICDAPNSILLDNESHIIKPHDTPEHLSDLQKHNRQIISEYRSLAKSLSLFTNVFTVNVRESDPSEIALTLLPYTGYDHAKNKNTH